MICHVTVETTGTMLLGSEIGAALTALEPLGIDLIGLNCATGPAEMSEHLRYLSQHARVPLSVMPNAGLPELTAAGARYPLTPGGARRRPAGGSSPSTAPAWSAAAAARRRSTSGRSWRRLRDAAPAVRQPQVDAGVSSIYHHVPFAQDASVLMVGERTNANGSKAFREAMLAGDFQACVEIARDQARDGSHLLDLCVDYVGRDGALDMREVAGRFATASTLPIMLDSTEPAVVEAGLEMLGGRCVVNSVNFEDGDGPNSRYARVMPIVAEHGAAVVALTIDEEGQARTAEWKVRVAERLIADLTGRWGLSTSDILIDCLTFPISTGQDETRRDAIETIEAIREIARRYPEVNFTLGISNVSFGLNPAARQVLNSVFLHECVQAGLTSAIVHASKILPMSKIPDEQREVALDLVYDRRREGYDPLSRFIELFEGVDAASARASRAEELASLPLDERLQRRIIDGERNGLESDLDTALVDRPALQIINDTLLAGMKTVGELFGSGQMQLPFVLQSAEVMKTAVAYLEPHMEKADDGGKGRIVLATVKGDVHDIGKNLVDIILTNNGYEVVNIGIKQPISAILDAAEEARADAIGMSGLLVKSTVIMKENLQEMDQRGVGGRWPVLLGGAALTRAYVEDDLRSLYSGQVHYARDAFEGLSIMDKVMAVKRGEAPAVDADRERVLAERRERRLRHRSRGDRRTARCGRCLGALRRRAGRGSRRRRSSAPGWSRASPLAEYVAMLDERATFLGQWGLRGTRGGKGPSYEELVETEGRPRMRYWLDRLVADQVLEAAVVYGYFPCYSEGNTLVVLDENAASERARFTFPRQRAERRLCIADFFRPVVGRASTSSPCSWSPSASRSASTPRSCARPTRTGTTSRCTACPCSWPRRWPRRGTVASGRSWCCRPASRWPPSTRRTWPASWPPTSAAAGTRSATPPAPTWRTGRRSPRSWSRSGSGCTCRRSSSWTRSSRPTPSSSTTPRPRTSTPSRARTHCAALVSAGPSRQAMREAVHLLWPADRDRDPAGPVPRVGIVGHIDDRETTEVFLGLGERPVGEDGRTAARVDAEQGGRRVQPAVAEDEDTGGLHLLPHGPGGRAPLAQLLHRVVGHPLVVEGDQVQRHLKLLCSRAAGTTAAHLLHELTRADSTPRPNLVQAFRVAGRTQADHT